MYKQIIKTYLLQYLKLRKIPYRKSGKVVMIKCPFCNQDKMTANIIPNTHIINCFTCKKKYNLLDIAKKIETKFPGTEGEQYDYLKELLKVKVMTKTDELNIEKIFDFYVENGLDLMPIVKNTKYPIENEWQLKSHKEKSEWKNWLANGSNIGIKTGIKSNILAIDIDALTKPEKKEIRSGNISKERKDQLLKFRKERLQIVYKIIESIMGEPLIQENLGGHHLIYKYDKDIPKTYIKLNNIHLDIESEGGYILSFPSTLPNDSERNFKKLNKIPPLPEEFKKFLLSKMNYKNINKTNSEDIIEAIKTGDFKIDPKKFLLKSNNLEGICNTEFVKLGGILRKQLNTQQTEYVLNVLNKHMLENPMQQKAINAMVRELSKYQIFDEKELAQRVLEYLRDDVEEASRNEIAMTLVGTNRGEDKRRVDKVLKYLVKEEYITKKGTRYEIMQKANWKTNLINIGIPIDFKMPYFSDIMTFNWGDLILIGSGNARGKTHISMNIVKQLIKQNKKPKYLSLESGSRFAKIAIQLGLKEGDFEWDEVSNPTGIKLERNAITIIDWLCPNNYAEVDKLLQHFTRQLQKRKGLAIIFMQLRDNNEWLAKDLVKQFPAFACRYIYDNQDSGEFGRFEIDKTREPKIKNYNRQIPCQYNWESKELKVITENEIPKENKD